MSVIAFDTTNVIYIYLFIIFSQAIFKLLLKHFHFPIKVLIHGFCLSFLFLIYSSETQLARKLIQNMC